MPMPPLLLLSSEAEYRAYFRANCCGKIETHDGIQVTVRHKDFDHCCYGSSQKNDVKDHFSADRAQRIDWIAAALQDASLPMYVGWNRKVRKEDPSRRVTVVVPDFAVVIAITRPGHAVFTTAYVANEATIRRMQSHAAWT